MLIDFKKRLLKLFDPENSNPPLKNCGHYSLFDGEIHIGDFYFTKSLSYGIFNDNKIFMDIDNISIRATKYRIVDLKKDEIVGEISLSNFNLVAGKVIAELGNDYEWNLEFLEYRATMFHGYASLKGKIYNDRDFANIEWEHNNSDGILGLAELPIIGVVELRNSLNYLLVL